MPEAFTASGMVITSRSVIFFIPQGPSRIARALRDNQVTSQTCGSKSKTRKFVRGRAIRLSAYSAAYPAPLGPA